MFGTGAPAPWWDAGTRPAPATPATGTPARRSIARLPEAAADLVASVDALKRDLDTALSAGPTRHHRARRRSTGRLVASARLRAVAAAAALVLVTAVTVVGLLQR